MYLLVHTQTPASRIDDVLSMLEYGYIPPYTNILSRTQTRCFLNLIIICMYEYIYTSIYEYIFMSALCRNLQFLSYTDTIVGTNIPEMFFWNIQVPLPNESEVTSHVNVSLPNESEITSCVNVTSRVNVNPSLYVRVHVYECIRVYIYECIHSFLYYLHPRLQNFQVTHMLGYGYIRFIYQYTVPYPTQVSIGRVTWCGWTMSSRK